MYEDAQSASKRRRDGPPPVADQPSPPPPARARTSCVRVQRGRVWRERERGGGNSGGGRGRGLRRREGGRGAGLCMQMRPAKRRPAVTCVRRCVAGSKSICAHTHTHTRTHAHAPNGGTLIRALSSGRPHPGTRVPRRGLGWGVDLLARPRPTGAHARLAMKHGYIYIYIIFQMVDCAMEPGGARVADAGAERVVVRRGHLHLPGANNFPKRASRVLEP